VSGTPPTDPTPPGPSLLEAAVLVPVFRDSGGALRLVLVRRAEVGIHGGQLAFPGGKRDPGDGSSLATALREAHEEIGLAPGSVTVLATLPVVEVRVTGYRIAPFLARVVTPPAWCPAADEVAEVLEARVADLARPEAQGESLERIPGWSEPVLIRYYRIGPHRLWGASYRIVEPLLPRLLAGEWTV
jgi:8-oxo-dGTP pyrophosphatase MutT (NUDIX family)